MRALRGDPPAAPDAPIHQVTEANWSAVPRDLWHHYDEPTLPQQPGGFPVPNFALRANSSGGGSLGYWFGIGDAWAHVVARHLPPAPTVLDLGCGCGKLTRFLALVPDVRYVGVDIFLPHVLWCRRAFASIEDRFAFHHFDGYSDVYNPTGAIQTVDYALPAADASIDAVAAHSLFTHLHEPEARHYLAEIARVLKPGGRAVISLHVEPPAGQAYVNDHDRSDVDLDYFLAMAAAAGLAHHETLGVIYGQTGVVLARRQHG
ncbi:class I SAM-dependent methyltransferase [Phenylobacterium sp.]|uniref:class I SAM-dependent methyltransferase n=1 Tax=Phenylobacterium sp. TaxID=1871053 RepID=UPI0025F1FB60|nr:class I SAM-dependent methyltransferase [Phenylobacterium sp.]MBX3486229.1 class I SAM-dependent methyltransferase [Phenylobacterium sp.]MCW5760209.1 class I SAM-dependent methyltransferase [Phenylobacterium sp.]